MRLVRYTCPYVIHKITSKGRHAEIVVLRRDRSAAVRCARAVGAQTSGSRQNSGSTGRRTSRLWREASPLVGAGGGAARARPPVFPRTMPNGAFVKVSSFTADAGRRAPLAARRALLRRTFATAFAPIEGRRKAAERLFHFAPNLHPLASALYYR